MKFFIGSDHAGLKVKAEIIKMVEQKGHEIIDLGPNDTKSVDYPVYAHKVCQEVLKTSNSNGILICGSGIGMSMAANRHKGIRAALCHNSYTASVTKKHNDANVLCLGERVLGLGLIESILDAWCENKFEGGRHENRVHQIEL